MLAFKPPKPSVTTIQIIQALIPLANRLYLKGLTLDVDEASIARLEAIRGHSAVLAPNHPAHEDSYGYVSLVKAVIATVLLHAAREAFDRGRFGAIRCYLMQRCGAYTGARHCR